MKPQIPNDTDSQLGKLLHEWKVESPLPPRFEEQVWRRVARADEPAVSPLFAIRKWIAQLVVRPSFAYSYATILLMAGLLGGFWQAQAASHRTSETLRARYVQTVDPYQLPRP